MVNKKNVMLGIIFALATIIVISNVSATNYQWYCLSKGQTLKFSLCYPTMKDRTCTTTSCPYCVYKGTRGEWCPGPFNACNKISGGQCSASSTGGNSTLDLTPPVLIVNSPVDSKVYNSRSVLFDLSTNEPSFLYYLDNLNGRGQWKVLASKLTLTYKKSISLSDGPWDLSIKAVDKAGNPTVINKKFYVDSQAPKIKSTTPLKGFTDGTFTINFAEQNPKTIMLYYGNPSVGQRNSQLDITNDCVLAKGLYTCNKKVTVDAYNNMQIMYYFAVTDIANVIAQSKQIQLSVDTQKPVINNPTTMFSTDPKGVNFNININEKNFKEVDYIDNSAKTPRSVKLCTSLKNNICSKKVTMNKGEHDLTITVIDNAGNSATTDVVANVS